MAVVWTQRKVATLPSNSSVPFAVKRELPISTTNYKIYLHIKIIKMYLHIKIIGQMAAKGSNDAVYVCYTSDSTTGFTNKFDESIWNEIWALVQELSRESTEAHTSLSEGGFRQVTILAEFPFLQQQPCACVEATSTADTFGQHALWWQRMRSPGFANVSEVYEISVHWFLQNTRKTFKSSHRDRTVWSWPPYEQQIVICWPRSTHSVWFRRIQSSHDHRYSLKTQLPNVL